MSLPANFGGSPKEEIHHHLRNVCLEFKKAIASKDISRIETEMERLINAGHEMQMSSLSRQKNSDVFHKDTWEKTFGRVKKEYTRFINTLKKEPVHANPQDLIDSLADLESIIRTAKV